MCSYQFLYKLVSTKEFHMAANVNVRILLTYQHRNVLHSFA